MSLIIVYFHGYGSSPNSDKVEVLRSSFDSPVFSFPINIDPDKAIADLSHRIDMMLLEDMHADDKVVFVGTSMGGWMASEMGKKYNIPAIVINPAWDPSDVLAKLGVDESICSKYDLMSLSDKNAYFFADHDELIDNHELRVLLSEAGHEVYVDPEGDHRFGGEPFKRVVKYIKSRFGVV